MVEVGTAEEAGMTAVVVVVVVEVVETKAKWKLVLETGTAHRKH